LYHQSQMLCHSSELYLLSKVQKSYLFLGMRCVQDLPKYPKKTVHAEALQIYFLIPCPY